MARLSCVCRLVALSLMVMLPAAVLAQGAAEGVNIFTIDGVKLRGAYYPAEKKCNATVILLHPIGEGKNMKAPEWRALAEALQKANCSVLMFDFRGHGDSTTIDDEKAFWGARAANGNFPNAALVRSKSKDTIEVRDYIKQIGAYGPVLINDIAAARAYLERRNDTTKDANTSNLIVIGADTGGTLGAIWINSEWSRCKYTPPPNPMFMKGQFESRSEGADIIGAVFLSIDPKLDKSRTISLPSVLKVPCKDHAMAALFLAGKDEIKYNKTLESKLKVKGNKHQYIGAVPLETNLSGVKLLTKGLKTDEAIVKYLSNVIDDRKNEWMEREYDKNVYMWRLPNGGGILSKKKGDRSLVFDDYTRFISQ
ncbi:MAG TPA: alpha/beta fold hydrolase [Gemmataceae bacterium]|nr:alpha/beta fold hydrolase [Gemmataceae bacterium]